MPSVFWKWSRAWKWTGAPLPANIKDALARGTIALYRPPEPRGRPLTEYFDFRSNSYQPIEPRPGILTLRDRKRTHGVVFENAGASLDRSGRRRVVRRVP